MEEFNRLVSKAERGIMDVVRYVENDKNIYEYLCEVLCKNYLTMGDIVRYVCDIEGVNDLDEIEIAEY